MNKKHNDLRPRPICPCPCPQAPQATCTLHCCPISQWVGRASKKLRTSDSLVLQCSSHDLPPPLISHTLHEALKPDEKPHLWWNPENPQGPKVTTVRWRPIPFGGQSFYVGRCCSQKHILSGSALTRQKLLYINPMLIY